MDISPRQAHEAAGLVLYEAHFKKAFTLIDLEYARNYQQYQDLQIGKQIAHYKMDYQTYKNEHNALVEKPWTDLLKIPEQKRSDDDKLKIWINVDDAQEVV